MVVCASTLFDPLKSANDIKESTSGRVWPGHQEKMVWALRSHPSRLTLNRDGAPPHPNPSQNIHRQGKTPFVHGNNPVRFRLIATDSMAVFSANLTKGYTHETGSGKR
jgi:hypothetical protein